MISERKHVTNGDRRADLLTSLVRQAESDGVTTDEQIRATVKMWFGADQLQRYGYLRYSRLPTGATRVPRYYQVAF